MTQAELQKLLRDADPAAVLVSARILERIIREDCGLPNMHWNVPHFKSYVCDRQMLFRHAEQADLELESDQLLPDTVILLVRPDQEELSNLERKRLLLKYWRRLFHARVHLALGSLSGDGLLDEAALRERVEVIGRTEFEEIRQVLIADRWLPEKARDHETYVEFAAVYLEMRQFAASLLPNYFPGIRDFGRVETLLSRDVDAADLFAATRLTGAGDPVQPIDSRGDETQELYWKLVRQAQASGMDGNLVGAAILRMRASRVAPAAQTLPTRQEAEKDIAQLGQRLAAALTLSDTETNDWIRHLTLLLDKADQGAHPMEARVLEDFLRVCEDHEKEIYTLDVVEYLLSGGKRPIKRPLPSQRLVRIAKHLRSALAKLGPVRLSDADRNQLTRLTQQALSRTEEGLRTRFRPVLETALDDVGLKPNGPLDQAAFDKMIAELLDRISSYGYLTFAELRDTLSRNQLKLPDLTEPEDFIRGDALIRLDRRLGSLLDGVYRPGEFYVRYLERFTALKFGTWWGRWFTRFVTGPFLLAWLVLFVLGFLVEEVNRFVFDEPHLESAARVLTGPALSVKGETRILGEPAWVWHLVLLVPLGFFFMSVLERPRFRRRCVKAFVAVWRALRFLCWDAPLQLLPLRLVNRIASSWLFQLLYWYLLKPALFTLLFVVLSRGVRESWSVVILTFIVVSFLLNSRVGRGTSEAIFDAFVNLGRLVRAGLLPGLFRLIVYVFKQVVESIEYVLFVVDEWLRFRKGDSQASLFVRTIASLIWSPIAFVARFFLVVLIEPGYNPLKAPVSYLAAKIMAPMTVVLMGQAWDAVSDWPGIFRYPVYAFLFVTIFHLCDVFGFLFWEMKENWGLYRSNRSATVRPAAIGTHGETVRGLLQPGFHSGTVPRLYARLRLAERRAMQMRNWNTARAYRHEAEELAGIVQRFVQREMLLLLRLSSAWRGAGVSAGTVSLSTNRIRVELDHLDHPAEPVEIEIEHHKGWLVAGIAAQGWLARLPVEQLRVFGACLAYLYKRSDVDLVREQIHEGLAGPVASWHLTASELVIYPSADATPLRIPLLDDVESLVERKATDRLIFSRTPITWSHWAEVWRQDSQGEGHPGLPGLGDIVVKPPPPSAPPPAQEVMIASPETAAVFEPGVRENGERVAPEPREAPSSRE